MKRLWRRQYDQAIIERTIYLVLGPLTALYRSFLKHCPLTNKAVGTIWRALSKPHQRRHGPDPRPIWLLVGTTSAFGPGLVYRLRVAQPTLMNVTRYFWYNNNNILLPLCFSWLLVLSLYKAISYKAYAYIAPQYSFINRLIVLYEQTISIDFHISGSKVKVIGNVGDTNVL